MHDLCKSSEMDSESKLKLMTPEVVFIDGQGNGPWVEQGPGNGSRFSGDPGGGHNFMFDPGRGRCERVGFEPRIYI